MCLGVLSLIFWALILVISIKYLAVHHALRQRRAKAASWRCWPLWNRGTAPAAESSWLIAIGLFGAALLYGDGMITPAISVLSAVEGLEVPPPGFRNFVVPVTIGILFLLFLFQRRGTAGVAPSSGRSCWSGFVTLAALGIVAHRAPTPRVLAALNPIYAVAFLSGNGWSGFVVLGAVFLVVTGGEALYADMGHFGPRPDPTRLVRPGAPGTAAELFRPGRGIAAPRAGRHHPFYHLAPAWLQYPLIGLATVATVIASQAVISGAFSLTNQAVQLGLSPRMHVVQTSPERWARSTSRAQLAADGRRPSGLVLGFGSSSNLAAAYGVAVDAPPW